MSETLEDRLLIDRWTPREEAAWRKLGREAAAELSRLRAEVEALNNRNVETSMLAYKWMEAHDKRAAGKPYDLPTPADVPNSIARALAAEQALAQAGEALEPGLVVKDAATQIRAAMDERNPIMASDADVLLWHYGRVLNFLRTLPSEPVNASKDGGAR